MGSGLTSKGKLKNFEIAGVNKKFYEATAKIVGNKVRVHSKQIQSPKHVRYAWKTGLKRLCSTKRDYLLLPFNLTIKLKNFQVQYRLTLL